MIAADSTFRKVVIHPVAVEVPTPLSHIIVADLDEILGGIYVTEVTESLVVQVLEALAACIIRMPVPNIASKREEDDITRTGQRFDFICPFIGIFTEFIHGDRTHVAVSPAVGGNFKTVVAQALDDFCCVGAFFLKVEIRVFRFVLVSIVGGIGAVAQDAIVTGKSNARFCAAVGEIRVLFDEIIQ